MSRDPLSPLRSERWRGEARRKAIHLASLILPLALLAEWLPWPRGRAEWRWLLMVLVLGALAIDVVPAASISCSSGPRSMSAPASPAARA